MYGDSFATFYRASQIRIFSALDNALSQKAEETLTEFAAVKNADSATANFTRQPTRTTRHQPNRRICRIIKTSESAGKCGLSAAINDTKGMNAGIFYRRVQNDLLYGINAFADYEDGDNGSFLRRIPSAANCKIAMRRFGGELLHADNR